MLSSVTATGIYNNLYYYSSSVKIAIVSVLLLSVFNAATDAARISDAQIQELRSSVPGLRSGSVGAGNLGRYLQASNGRVSLAATKLRRTSDWRSENSIDNVLTSYVPSQLINESLPYQFTGYSNEGKPVVYIPLGKWNFRKLRREGKIGDVSMYTNQLLERAFKETENSVNLKSGGQNVNNTIFIVDFRGFNIRSLVQNLGGNLFAYWRLRLLHDDHYPLLGEWYMLRTPPYLRLGRHFSRRRNVHWYSRWSRRGMRTLSRMIPASSLPTTLGGSVNVKLS